MVGDNLTGIEVPLEWVTEFGATCVSVDYRLAPENPDPAPVEDCYAGLVWTHDHASELDVDPDAIMVAGGSAGGGLAAGTVLMARDRFGPPVAAQLLMCPMLDDRGTSRSGQQFDDDGPWSRRSNETGWRALLGNRAGGDDVSSYAAPARAADLSGLPPTFIDVGSAEIFRDESVAYASGIWASGGRAELHVWPGGFHEFDMVVPDAGLSRRARDTRTRWVQGQIASWAGR